MADIISDGKTSVVWMLTCASQTAPTAAELSAGVDLETFITPDGLDIQSTVTNVDTGSLASTQDSEVPGRKKDQLTLTFKHQGDAAVPWTTFASRPDGFICIRYGVDSTTAYTTASVVDLYPIRSGDRMRMASAPNEVLKFQVNMYVSGDVQQSVTLS